MVRSKQPQSHCSNAGQSPPQRPGAIDRPRSRGRVTAVGRWVVAATFRIKICDQDDGDTVVYDNKTGASDDSNDGTVLGRRKRRNRLFMQLPHVGRYSLAIASDWHETSKKTEPPGLRA